MFLKKLFSIKINNVISFLPVSERKKPNKQVKIRVIIGLPITGNNEIRLLTFMF